MSEPLHAAVAITGISVLTPLGDNLDAFNAALLGGQCSVEASEGLAAAGVSRLRDFDASRYANVRGMRVYARGTQLEICAAKLALADAGLDAAQLDPLQLGLVTASTFTHLETLLEYDRGLVSVGTQRTNPTLMPLALPSTPGAATALSIGAKAFSITLSDGGASGLAALGLAVRLVAEGRAQVCVVAGAFTVCRELMLSAARAGLLASAERFAVLDSSACGMAFGEAAAALVFEPSARAAARGRQSHGVVLGHASTFATDASRLPGALARACRSALANADTKPQQLALIASGANGQPEHDRAHGLALLDALGAAAERPSLTAIKANLGESFDPSALLQTIAALGALRARMAPPIARLREPALAGLRYATQPTVLDAGHALVTSTSQTGACSALVLATTPARSAMPGQG